MSRHRHADPQSYDRLADHYERLTGHEMDVLAEWLPSVLTTGSLAVDVGCGAGRHAVILAERYEHVLGVDASAPMIELAKRVRSHERVTYHVEDLFETKGEFDLVFSSATLHHVKPLLPALEHLRSLVRTGGQVIIADVTAPQRRSYRFVHHLYPRGFFVAGALLHLVVDFVSRRPDAVNNFRMATYQPWLDHLATDRFLTAEEFDTTYGSVFPGATLTQLRHLRVCRWTARETPSDS
jgi:SAM-dependent methyltransferase